MAWRPQRHALATNLLLHGQLTASGQLAQPEPRVRFRRDCRPNHCWSTAGTYDCRLVERQSDRLDEGDPQADR
jgi:hypothetical protein